MCRDTIWVSHEIMLAQQNDLRDFVMAIVKVCECADELARSELW